MKYKCVKEYNGHKKGDIAIWKQYDSFSGGLFIADEWVCDLNSDHGRENWEPINEVAPLSMDTKEVNGKILKTWEMVKAILEDNKKRFENCQGEGIVLFNSVNFLVWENNDEFLINDADYTWREIKRKPTLTSDERVILSNIDSKYKWIARDKDNELSIYIQKPKKYNDREWDNYESYKSIRMFNHLYQFIKWEDLKPWNIKELLES